MNSARYLFIFLLLSVGCSSGGKQLRKAENLTGLKVPGLIVEDLSGRRISLLVFREKETAFIVYGRDEKVLKAFPVPAEYHLKFLDVRSKPWYYPWFLYRRRFSTRDAVPDGRKGLGETWGMESGDYVIELERGTVKSVCTL